MTRLTQLHRTRNPAILSDVIPNSDSPVTIAARVLAFMGQFSQTQFMIDWVIELYFRDVAPDALPILKKTLLANLADRHRIDLLEAVAASINYAGDLSTAKGAFDRAKRTRDFLGHAQGVAELWNPATQRRELAVTHETGRRHALVPDPLLPDTIDELQADCRWISDHAIRIIFEGNLSQIVDATGKPSEPPLPPPRPR